MNNSAPVTCPKCGEEIVVNWVSEDHKVSVEIGMMTVARDEYRYLEGECDCDLTEKQEEKLFEKGAKKIAKRNRYSPPDGIF